MAGPDILLLLREGCAKIAEPVQRRCQITAKAHPVRQLMTERRGRNRHMADLPV